MSKSLNELLGMPKVVTRRVVSTSTQSALNAHRVLTAQGQANLKAYRDEMQLALSIVRQLKLKHLRTYQRVIKELRDEA